MALLKLPTEILRDIARKLAYPAESGFLAPLAQTNRLLNEITTSIRFENIVIFFNGSVENTALYHLASLSMARDESLGQIRSIRVIGNWFAIFSEIESELGSYGDVGPGVRLLDIVMVHLIRRTKYLRSFTWDLQVAPSQDMVTVLSRMPALESISFRLSTDHTLNPFYFPRLRFHGFDSLRSLSLLAVDSATILEDAAEILSCSMIDHLVVTAGNHTLGQSPMPLFSKIPKTKPLRLKSFDIQGYDVLSLPDMWERVVASELHEITVKLPEDSGVMSFDESNVFWSGMLHEASRVSYLCTDMVCSALLKLIGTSKVDVIGIKHLILIPAGDILDEKYDLVNNFLEQTLHRVSENLVTLALYARNGDTSKIACSKSDLRKILIECKKLNEVGIVLANNDLSILFDTITLAPGLKAFQIMPIEDGPELRPQNAMSGMQEVLNRRKELHLKILGVRFQQVYQFLRDEEGVVKGERLSLGFWEGGLNSKLFCSKLTEW